MAQITYDTKVALYENSGIADINKVKAADMNEIKSTVNANDNKVGELSDLDTTDKSSIVNAINELVEQNTYSTTETVIGTWLGKPLYRKVIDMGALPNATAKDVQHNISNIDNVVHIYGWAYRSSDNFRIPLPFTSPDVSANALLGVLGNYVRITTGTDRSSFAVSYAILEYTKITD